jgi:hypothetical protein
MDHNSIINTIKIQENNITKEKHLKFWKRKTKVRETKVSALPGVNGEKCENLKLYLFISMSFCSGT